MKKRQLKAFTLIELLVVIAIIGVLTAIILPNMLGMRERARDTAKKNNLHQIKTALRLYYNDHNTYPASNAGAITGCGTDTPTDCADGAAFELGGETYMKELPLLEEYTYLQTDAGDGFLLSTTLENISDKDLAASANRCGITVGEDNTNVFYLCED